MLNLEQAVKVIRKVLPKGKIQKAISYRGLYIFQVFRDEIGEEELDPFYSVNKKTGEFNEFSIITDGDITEIVDLFTKTKNVFNEKSRR